MAAISLLNPKAEYVRTSQALAMNISGAKGLQDVMKPNLGPKGTTKMLVSGSGDIKITKDGNILLHEMQIQHPIASLIARASTAMNDVTGDGCTTMVLLIAELLHVAENLIAEGVHPRALSEGFSEARKEAMKILDTLKKPLPENFDDEKAKFILQSVARTSLGTKLPPKVVSVMTEVCYDAVMSIYKKGENLDLHMIEVMTMQNKTTTDTQLVKGLVLDHGSRHPNMPKRVTNAFILTCNVSLEYEKTEVNSSIFYSTAEEREKMKIAERDFIDQRVKKIIALKKQVCDGNDCGFVVINQKGIDPLSLDALAKEDIMALRRAKRRNMERLTLACGGTAMNTLDDLTPECLGKAGLVYEYVLGENKYTFVLECPKPQSVTVLIHGPTNYAINQVKDALRGGLRAVKNAIEDDGVLPGGAAVELKLAGELNKYAEKIKERKRVGINAFADALLIVPKTLAQNAGHNIQDVLIQLKYEMGEGRDIGLDIDTGKPMDPEERGIFENVCVKRQCLAASVDIASNLLLVDEVMRAGLSKV
uniref:Putative chaperonin subunit 6a zeta n=1 Tax=Triatoma dimidiata TaxID=72491 RepID=A0A0V0G5Y7_TRIDM